MHTTYYKCEWCNRITSDLDSSIPSLSGWSFCNNCVYQWKRKGLLCCEGSLPKFTYVLINRKSDERRLFDSWETFEQAVKRCGNPEQYEYGFWDEPISQRLRDAYMKQNNCGSMNEDDVRTIFAHAKQAGFTELMLAVRGDNRLICLCEYDLGITSTIFMNSIVEGKPFLLSTNSSGDDHYIDDYVLSEFQDPDNNSGLLTYSSFNALVEERDYMLFECDDIHWKPTSQLLDKLIGKKKRQISKCNDKIRSLKRLKKE